MAKKVVVGMSGGVDSSVAAYLLKEQGYEVIGLTMETSPEPDNAGCDGVRSDETGKYCGAPSVAEDARRVAEQLGIRHYVVDFRREFHEHVIRYFVDEYRNGRTPNPCIACNRYVKWEAMLQRSMEMGADYIATGHYARIVRLENGRYTLKQSVTSEKDQTYALYNLTQEQLEHTLMPVGEYEKNAVRQMAEDIGLSVANKPDSQEICFVPDHDYASFIRRETGECIPEGNFVDVHGNVLGRHKGIIHYTVGQRKGLGLAMGHPVFVTEMRPETNEVVIGEEEDVFSSVLRAGRLNFMSRAEIQGEIRVMAKIRYNHRGDECVLRMDGPDIAEVRFTRPQRAVTPGQAVVFYEGDRVLGGGTIL